jgi:Ca2+-transporting ATPase
MQPGPAPWASEIDALLREQQVDATTGLGTRDVAARRALFGANLLSESDRRGVLPILIDQFRSIVVVLLLGVGILAIAFRDVAEGLAIFAVILINGGIGFVTEWRATRSMEALRQYARVDCVVLRDGAALQLPAEQLVPGDVVLLDAGDLVPADLRLVEAARLTADESTLTGESLPVHKHTRTLPADTALLDRRNMLYKGTVITRGSGRGVVTGTGRETEFGRIFEQVRTAEAQLTPLEKRLNMLGERLAWAVIGMGGIMVAAGIWAGHGTLLAVEVAVALAVAAIPEGLPIVATITLARGMWRMARRNALITRLSAVETLGATSVILTDKTGTLTENRMAVTKILSAGGALQVQHAQTPGRATFLAGTEPLSDRVAEWLDESLRIAVLCNNAALARTGAVAVGDPTEVALLLAASGRGLWRDELLQAMPELREDAFDPESKRMATLHADGDAVRVAVKGAPEAVLPLCASALTESGVRPLDEAARVAWLDNVARLGSQGLRTIALAGKKVTTAEVDPYADLTLVAVMGLEDPPREGVGEALDICRRAGIDVVMVTGDHATTAGHVAAAVGLTDGSAAPGRSLDGSEVGRLLSSRDDDQLLAAKVFSRVTPEQKLALIALYQRQGHVVAMTGDGVNDAPALKKADIGVAMGVRGTAVAREAAAMVLQDDDFSTIVAAVAHGRAIFENIRKFVVYLLSCNISEVLVVGLATVVGAPLPLLPLQILFLNLVTDVFPALALGVGPGAASLMSARPRPAGESILTRGHWIRIGLHGVVMALTVLAAMTLSVTWLEFDRERSVAVAFCTLAAAQLLHVFNMRDNLRNVLRNEITRNAWIWAALSLCLLLVLGAVYIRPVADVLALTDPGTAGWVLILSAAVVPLAAAPVVRGLAAALVRGNAGMERGE